MRLAASGVFLEILVSALGVPIENSVLVDLQVFIRFVPRSPAVAMVPPSTGVEALMLNGPSGSRHA